MESYKSVYYSFNKSPNVYDLIKIYILIYSFSPSLPFTWTQHSWIKYCLNKESFISVAYTIEIICKDLYNKGFCEILTRH